MADFFSQDPTADFLARERAILGDDANAFGNDIISSSTVPSFSPIDDTTHASDSIVSSSVFPPSNPLMNATEPISNISASSGTWGGPSSSLAATIELPKSPAQMSNYGESPVILNSSMSVPEVESEALRKWNESFQQTIIERDAVEARAKQDAINKAKADIDKFYEEYNAKRDRALQESKQLQEQMVLELNDSQSGTFWERVSKNVELASTTTTTDSDKHHKDTTINSTNKKFVTNQTHSNSHVNNKDTTRFKQVLSTLKAAKASAPGA